MKWPLVFALSLSCSSEAEIIQRIREVTRCSATVVRYSAVTPEPAGDPQVIYDADLVTIKGEGGFRHYVTARNQTHNACGLPLLGLPVEPKTRIFGKNDYTAFTLSANAMIAALKTIEPNADGGKELPVCSGKTGYRLTCYDGDSLSADQISQRGKIIIPQEGTPGYDCKDPENTNLKLVEDPLRRDSETIDKMVAQVKAAYALAGDRIFPDPSLKQSDDEHLKQFKDLNECRFFMTDAQIAKLNSLTRMGSSAPAGTAKTSNSSM